MRWIAVLRTVNVTEVVDGEDERCGTEKRRIISREKNKSSRVSPLSARETPIIQRRDAQPAQPDDNQYRRAVPCKTTDAMVSDPPLIGIDHGRTIERAAPV